MGVAEDIQSMFKQMNADRRGLLYSIVRLVYFMRGAIQYKDMFEMTSIERETVGDFIDSRLEAENQHVHPVY